MTTQTLQPTVYDEMLATLQAQMDARAPRIASW